MHNSQNTSPSFMKFLQQLSQSIINKFQIEHFSKIILFQPQISRAKQKCQKLTSRTNNAINIVLLLQ